jgi:F-type H+-transporting ATPase subunit gamma
MKSIPRRPTLLLAKIQSFTKFRDVVKCIQLVSLSSLKKLKNKLATRHIALSAVKELFYVENNSNLDISYYEDKRISFVVITTEKSCSGSINNRTNRMVLKFYQKIRGFIKFANFLFLGKKGLVLVRRRFKTNLSLRLFRELEKDVNCLLVSYLVVNDIHKKKFDVCLIFFNKFESGFNSKFSMYQIDSFDTFLLKIFSNDRPSNKLLDLLVEKNISDDFFFLELYYFAFCLVLLDALEENNYSELASRAQAMESAVTNTTDRIAFLTLVYNKTRQALITNEIIEVLNASSAIK